MIAYGSRRRHAFGSITVVLVLITLCLYSWRPPWIPDLDAAGFSLARPSDDQPKKPITPPPLVLPGDYSLSPGKALCEKMYGRGYFEHIEEHQNAYCNETTSSSFLQCFSAPRHPLPWASQWSSTIGDPFCIAQGVVYEPDNGDRHFKAHCNRRDFASEGSQLPNLESLPEYWGGSGVGGEFKTHWSFEPNKLGSGCSKSANNGEWLYVIKREETPNVWHRLMDIFQSLVTLDAMQAARNPATGEPWMTPDDVASMRIVFDDKIEGPEPLQDWWRLLNGKAPGSVSSLEPGTCFGNVLVPLAGSSSPFWAALLEKVHHEPCQNQLLIDAFRRRVFRFLDIVPRSMDALPNEHPVITLVNRTHNRVLFDADNLMAQVRQKHPGAQVNVVDFSKLSLREQVELVVKTDILIGHHGAGLLHLFFLSPDAAVIEITSSRARKFRSISRMRGIAHFEADCLEQPEYANKVHGTPLPAGWRAGADDQHWQSREYAYLLEEDFLGVVDAAVRNQRNRRYV